MFVFMSFEVIMNSGVFNKHYFYKITNVNQCVFAFYAFIKFMKLLWM